MKDEKTILIDLKNSRDEVITKAITGPLWTSDADLMTVIYKQCGDVLWRFHSGSRSTVMDPVFNSYVNAVHSAGCPIECSNYYDVLDQITHMLAEHDYQSPEDECWIITVKMLPDGTACADYITAKSESEEKSYLDKLYLNQGYGINRYVTLYVAILHPFSENILFRNFDTLEDIANLMDISTDDLKSRLLTETGFTPADVPEVTMDLVYDAYDERGIFFEDLCCAYHQHCHGALRPIHERNAHEILDSVICKTKKRLKKLCQMSMGCEVITSWIDGHGTMYRTIDSDNGRILTNMDTGSDDNLERYYFDEWKVTDWKGGDDYD